MALAGFGAVLARDVLSMTGTLRWQWPSKVWGTPEPEKKGHSGCSETKGTGVRQTVGRASGES
jgi:hypothetical protein